MARYPGSVSQQMLEELSRYVIAEPEPFVIDLEKSEGMWLATVDGQRIFDWAGYYASKLIGHNHPRLYEPEYLKRIARAANNKVANPDFLTPECLEYYRLLYELAPACMRNPRLEVYVVNSGAEAVENMMKYLINLHHHKLLKKGRLPNPRRFIYFDQAFHGRTVFALNITQVTHDPVVTKDFHGFIPGNIQVPFPAIDTSLPESENRARTQRSLEIVEDFLQRYDGEVVGIIVEPLQGAGGHRVALPEFFQGLSLLAHQYDVYLGFDEVQTAGGQTGTFFACDQFNLPYPPQAVATAKKLGNGAVYMLYPMEDRGVLDSTWGGTLGDMVRFVQEMKIVREERLIEQVPSKTAVLVEGLTALAQRYPHLIFNVRGMGLYQGFSLRLPELRKRLLDIALQEEDLLLLGAGTDTVRLRPSLSVTVDEIRLFSEKMERVMQKLAEESR
ncbi:MAG: aspartate aminotransferase family protein [Armatimonadota bacterium]